MNSSEDTILIEKIVWWRGVMIYSTALMVYFCEVIVLIGNSMNVVHH